MIKTILGSFAAAALVSGAVYAAPCDDVAACNPCGDVSACNPCDDSNGACDPCGVACGPKRSKRTVYADAGVMVGNVDGGFTNNQNFTMAGGVKATIGVQRGTNGVELGYTGLYNNLSTTGGVNVLANFNSVDANFVKTLERNKNLKVFVGIGYANMSENDTVADEWLSNDLAGLHVGGKWGRDFGRTKRAGIETYGKLGVYANTVSVDAGSVGILNSLGNSRGAWVAAGGINLTYKLTKRVKAFAGYDMTYIEGVVRDSGLAALRATTDDRVLVQGFVFGAKAAY